MQTGELEVIYKQLSDKVYNLALSYLQHTLDAEEVCMDVFMEVHRSYDKFLAKSSVQTWVYRITVNKCLDKLRQKKRRKERGETFSMGVNAGIHETRLTDFEHPGVLLEQKENATILWKAIAQLPDNQKAAFILRQVENCTQPEIAEVLGVSVGAVESLLQRAKSNLRDQIRNYFNT